MEQKEPLEQLVMIKKAGIVKKCDLPEGYRYENYHGTQEERDDWHDICQKGDLLPLSGYDYFTDVILNYPDLKVEKDLLFVVSPEGKRVATTASVVHPANSEHPHKCGYIHMVSSLPEVRGKGIGRAMLAKSLELLEAEGVEFTYLTTDDFRASAVKGYLWAGFEPDYSANDNTKERWQKIFDKLGIKKD